MRLLVLKSGSSSALMKWLGAFNVTFTEACARVEGVKRR